MKSTEQIRRISTPKSKSTTAIPVVLLSVVVVLGLVPDALAESGSDHGSGLSELIPYWVNFAIYLVIVYFLTRKLVAKAWAERRQRIIDDIAGAKNQYQQAGSQLADAQAKWNRLSQEETRVRDEVARQGEFERNQLLEAAQAKSVRIITQAKEHGIAERRSAERLVREELVEEVLNRASRILKDTATVDADRGFRTSAVGVASRLVH